MTASVNVPFDLALIEDLYDALPRRLGEAKLTDLSTIGVLPRPSIASPSPMASWIVSPTRTRPKTLPSRSGQIVTQLAREESPPSGLRLRQAKFHAISIR